MRALLIASLLIIACGDDTSDAADAIDAAVLAVDASAVCNDSCDPMAQTGCQVGEKCALVIDDVFSQSSHVGCTSDGTAALGDACGSRAEGLSDTCRAGAFCYLGVCREICATPAPSCGAGACFELASPFFEPTNVCTVTFDVCAPTCDAVAQDCDTSQAAATCVVVGPHSVCLQPSDDLAVGSPCEGMGRCIGGSGCHGTPATCMRYCRTTGPTPGTECGTTEVCSQILGVDGVGICAAPE